MRPLITLLICLLVTGATHPVCACTSFSMETSDGVFYATNLDFPWGDGHVFINNRGVAKEWFLEGTTGATAKWTSAYGSVTFNLLGREYPWSGLNEAGLVISTMELLASEFEALDERPGLSTPTWVQYMLDTCGSVEEVIAANSLVRVEDISPNHYMVADAAGDCAVIEFRRGEAVCYHGDDLPVRALANAPYEYGIEYLERGAVPPFNPGASVERVAKAVYRMERFRDRPQGSAVDFSMKVLTEVVVAPKRWWTNMFKEPCTRWSMVFDIAERRVYYLTVDSRQVKHLDLDNFDLSCESPIRMLDINAKLQGNVEGDFTPYDHDANLMIFREFCDKYDIEVSKGDSSNLVEFFDGFDCAR
ncbi:MAG: linear amide C-N hydrolase [bacterium]|nr:linear amide C-N hydrolase [bacterium]